MSFPRPIQWYHYHADLVWQDGTFNIKKHVKYPARQIRQVFLFRSGSLYFPYIENLNIFLVLHLTFKTINDSLQSTDVN
jgi:hypothetical protein